MNSTELVSLCRDELSDIVEPFLWSSGLLLSYLDDAQKMFCRLTEGIEDAQTPEICRITVVPGTEWYALDKRVLKTREVSRLDNGAEVPVYNVPQLRQHNIIFNGRGGPLRAVVQGMTKSTLRAWPVPTETVTLAITVFRLPLNPVNDFELELEIDEQHHRHLLLWMKHLAYSKQDAETFDKTKAKEFKDAFAEYCFLALREQSRARRASQPVLYGGI